MRMYEVSCDSGGGIEHELIMWNTSSSGIIVNSAMLTSVGRSTFDYSHAAQVSTRVAAVPEVGTSVDDTPNASKSLDTTLLLNSSSSHQWGHQILH